MVSVKFVLYIDISIVVIIFITLLFFCGDKVYFKFICFCSL